MSGQNHIFTEDSGKPLVRSFTVRSNEDVMKSHIGLRSNEHDVCFIKQVYLISLFYIVNVAVEVLGYYLGEEALRTDEIVCASDHYILVKTELGGGYMLFHALSILIYSLVMYSIFYRLPNSHYLVSYRKNGAKDINIIVQSRES